MGGEKMAKDKKLTKLTATHHKAIQALLTTRTNEDAAQAAGISRSTLQRFLRDPLFKLELERQKADSTAQTNARMTEAAAVAVQTLHEIMTNGRNEIARVQASREVLAIVYKNDEHESVTANRELKNELMRLQIDALKNPETGTEDHLKKYFAALQGAFTEGEHDG